MSTVTETEPATESAATTISLEYKNWQWFVAGFFFALLWASASTATKIGLTAAQPLVIAVVRFGTAALVLLFVTHLVKKSRLPAGAEWKQLAIYGFLNITIYLGVYAIAMQTVTAGIGTLAVASNPVFMSFLSVFFLRKKLTKRLVFSIAVCTIGVLCAAWPLFGTAAVEPKGLLLLFASMLSYSAGAIYFSAKKWNGLSLLTINGWQTFFGGIFLLPFALFFYQHSANHFNVVYWLSVEWLAILVSVFAVQLWLWLLQRNAVRAGLWLFLCPLFGFAFAAWLMNDAITLYTVAGVLLVTSGLLLSRLTEKKTKQSSINKTNFPGKKSKALKTKAPSKSIYQL
ncbi:MAG: DMT family transporter [Chitinophagaceae bacterium]|nr:MAG: DMT family transporter [Chitinophagaceae bacterium]